MPVQAEKRYCDQLRNVLQELFEEADHDGESLPGYSGLSKHATATLEASGFTVEPVRPLSSQVSGVASNRDTFM